MMAEVFYEEFGGIEHAWVRLPGRPAICVGQRGDSEEELVRRALVAWERRDWIRHLEETLRGRHPGQQIYRGYLPTPDADWPGIGGEYLYVLTQRRQRGRYRIAGAICIDARLVR
jgi:hypothetical protein